MKLNAKKKEWKKRNYKAALKLENKIKSRHPREFVFCVFVVFSLLLLLLIVLLLVVRTVVMSCWQHWRMLIMYLCMYLPMCMPRCPTSSVRCGPRPSWKDLDSLEILIRFIQFLIHGVSLSLSPLSLFSLSASCYSNWFCRQAMSPYLSLEPGTRIPIPIQ